jgi:LmbE family N-acetylglucosaminyl deacetylase
VFIAARHYRTFLCRAARLVPARELSRRAVVFSPHPDDEVLGCGGTILKKRAVGAPVHLVYMTDGGASTTLIPRSDLIAMRKAEATSAACALGVDSVEFLDFPDGQLHDHVEAATDRICEILRREVPQEIYIPYRHEPVRQAADHRTTTSIVWAALERLAMKAIVREYPVWFWYHWPWVNFRQTTAPLKTRHVIKNSALAAFGLQAVFGLNSAVDISDVQAKKRAALAHHKSQMERLIEDPHWVTLPQLSDGQFLGCFYQDFEFFHCSVSRSSTS